MPRFSLRAKLAIILGAIASAAAIHALVDLPHPGASSVSHLPDPQYLIVMEQPEGFADRVPPPRWRDARQIGFGVTLYTLSTPLDMMKVELSAALDKADATGYPVLVHLDDWNYMFRSDDPEIIEWTGFPEEGQSHGPLVERRWLYDGQWIELPPPPNYESPRFKAEVVRRVSALASLISARLDQWQQAGKGNLLAGVVCGWRSGIYRLPETALTAPRRGMHGPAEADVVRTGYAALTARGHTAQSIALTAKDRGTSEEDLRDKLLQEIVYDYVALWTRTAAETGVPRTRIYTHVLPREAHQTAKVPSPFDANGRLLPMWVSANGYARPGIASPDDTLDAQMVRDECRKLGYERWGAVDLALLPDVSTDAAYDLFADLYDNGAKVACLRPHGSGLRGDECTVIALRKWLDDQPEP